MFYFEVLKKAVGLHEEIMQTKKHVKVRFKFVFFFFVMVD
jgi:hypothetical protein